MTNIIKNSKIKRSLRVRSKLAHNLGVPRLNVFRSNRHIWAQVIDDKHGKTIVSSSSKVVKTTDKLNKTQIAALVGEQIAKLAVTKKVTYVRFDRGPYRYHGRVKALAQAARDNGLKF